MKEANSTYVVRKSAADCGTGANPPMHQHRSVR